MSKISKAARWLAGESRPRRVGMLGVAVAACLLIGLWAYDAAGYQALARFEAEHAGNPMAVLREWQSYQAWHPTRKLLQPKIAGTEDRHLHELNLAARHAEFRKQLTELRLQSAAPAPDEEAVWQRFQQLCGSFADVAGGTEFEAFAKHLRAFRDEAVRRRAEHAYELIVRAERDGTDLAVLAFQAEQFLHEFPDSPHNTDIRQRSAGYLRRLDERDIEGARTVTAQQPLNFRLRRDLYQRYLDKRPDGAFAAEARSALQTVAEDWDKNDFRLVRDQFVTSPGEVPELVTRCRSYLTVHPSGRFASSASDLLRWTERVTAPGEYRIILRGGDFEHRIARFFSRGPDLSVEIEVAGVRHGPSNIVVNRYDPDWNYEFPRRIRWKLGDPVRIRVTDHDYWPRVVLDLSSEANDPLGIRLVSGETWSGKNHLTFESDFHFPQLPAIE